MPSEARLNPAYVAGVFDVRGCVEIRTSRLGYSSAMVRLHLREPSLLRMLVARYGGRISPEDRRGSWRWTLHARGALPFLEEIMPHLLIKREEAAAALLLQREVSRNGSHGRIDARGRAVRTHLATRLRAARTRRGIRAHGRAPNATEPDRDMDTQSP